MPTQTEMLEHAKKRVYEDFAKIRAEIDKMEDGKRKAKALHLWYVLQELLTQGEKP